MHHQAEYQGATMKLGLCDMNVKGNSVSNLFKMTVQTALAQNENLNRL